MKKIHLEQCASTQEFLLQNLKNGNIYDLVSTEVQTEGKGRHQNKWYQLANTLCFSFLCKPNKIITFTSLEMALLVSLFFEEKMDMDIRVKWPNDLLTIKGEKCGGILLNNSNNNCVVGVGLNLFASPNEKNFAADYPVGSISDIPFEYSRKELAENIFTFIESNRMSADIVAKGWEAICFHQNKRVEITDMDQRIIGKFIGIGKNGEALIEQGLNITKVYNGSLRVRD